ncbi:hypothetical protein EWM64_g6077 [Hericium alpestre]|uniref:MMS19 nucleotide excision repair protein n=1 Tax=Hericium alpestre TaxID=135208 RepID=A0A4Y9ZUL5_9AGAM|nr:hypothetical protein EWM64_g6077 [Hericium alpestre]
MIVPHSSLNVIEPGQHRQIGAVFACNVVSQMEVTLVVRVLTKLDLLCLPASASLQLTKGEAEADEEPTAAYAHALLTTLANVLAKKVERKDVDVPKYIDQLVPRLFNLFIYSALTFSASNESRQGFVAATPKLLTVAGRIINLVVQTLDARRRQETFVSALIDAYLKGEAKKIAAGQPMIPQGAQFSPFDDGASSAQKNLVVLFSQALIALHKDVKVPVDDPTLFLQKILSWSLHHAESLLQRESAWHIVAAIINKRAQDLEPFISNNTPSLWSSEVVDTTKSAEGRRTTITAWTWIVKGLLLRSHPRALPLAQQLFDLFDDVNVSWDAARAVGQVVAADKVLTKPNHAVIKILYAQKYMSALLPRIIEGAKTQAEPQRQTAHLVALASLVTAMPKHTYAYELPTLLPLLLRGLDLPDSEIRANVIETFLSAARGDVESNAKASKEGSLVSGHASTLVSTMLKNSSAREMPNPVR